MFSGGIELSYRQEPHVQLLKGNIFDGYPVDQHNRETVISLEHLSDDRISVALHAFYDRRDFYQVKWWVMLPFSEDVSVNGDPVNVYRDDAAHEYGLEYGKSWTRIKLYDVRKGMTVKVGKFVFKIMDSDLKNLMIYRRLDLSLIELEWIWWNVDRNGVIPRQWFYTKATIEIQGGIPPKLEKPLLKRVQSKIRRMTKWLE